MMINPKKSNTVLLHLLHGFDELYRYSFARLRDCPGTISRYCGAMTKARKLLHTRYRVNDLERTIKFYKEILGLEEVRRHKSPRGSELVFLKAPESEELIELCCYPASGSVQVQPDLTHLAFEVDSLRTFGEHLAKLGIKYSDGPHMKPEGGGIAFIDAPEGYEIELIEMSRTGPGY
jgi:lactoylglutathione lyase